MANDNFLTISRAECNIAYKEILINSDQKWKTSELIAETGDYSSACSFAIISTEELVKALIVFFDGQGFNFRNVKGMSTIFRNHRIRYFILFFLYVMGLFNDEIRKLMSKVIKKPPVVLTRYNESKMWKKKFQGNVEKYILQKADELQLEIERFSKLDALRQASFYTDYEGSLKSPVTFSKEDFEVFQSRLSQARTAGKGIMNSFAHADEDTMGTIESFKKDFVKQGYYENIENAFKYMNDKRLNPFDAFMKSVFQIDLDNNKSLQNK
ncbi:AbiV family abortive infection protein [uncultured Draconibacterium sp.]|uniref:AbiV family abortive infection protein n=1 Tax=uncultured Draconibacterium sp. TaxID=1573823 RepID=UPI00321758C2